MSKKIILLIICVLVLINVNSNSYAFDENNKNSPFKFIKQFCLILEAREQLKLSDKQVAKIKAEKLCTQKAVTKADAEIDIISLDIKIELK